LGGKDIEDSCMEKEMSKVKIYGMQRSGNNFLMYLIASNFNINLLGNKYGWTHGPFQPESGADLNFIISKHPIAWLPSMWRYEKPKCSKAAYINTMSKWNDLYNGYKNDTRRYNNIICVKYEYLLTHPIDFLEAISANGLKRKEGDWRIAKNKMNKQMGETNKKFDPNYYLDKKFMSWYEGDMYEKANKLVNWDTAKAFGHFPYGEI